MYVNVTCELEDVEDGTETYTNCDKSFKKLFFI